MGVQGRNYDPDFKTNAVGLTEESGRSVKEVAENLGISENLFYRWRREHRSKHEEAFPGRGKEE